MGLGDTFGTHNILLDVAILLQLTFRRFAFFLFVLAIIFLLRHEWYGNTVIRLLLRLFHHDRVGVFFLTFTPFSPPIPFSSQPEIIQQSVYSRNIAPSNFHFPVDEPIPCHAYYQRSVHAQTCDGVCLATFWELKDFSESLMEFSKTICLTRMFIHDSARS